MASLVHEKIDRAVLDRDFGLVRQLLDTLAGAHTSYEHIVHMLGHSGTLSGASFEAAYAALLASSLSPADRHHVGAHLQWARHNRTGALEETGRAIEAGDTSFHIHARRALAARSLSDLDSAIVAALEAARLSHGPMQASLNRYAEEMKALSAIVYRTRAPAAPADSGAAPGSTALFLKTYAGDVGRLPYLFRSIDKYARDFDELVIVTDDGCDVGILPTSLPVRRYDVPAPQVSHRLMRGVGYWWQQSLKMTWPDFSKCDAAVILDSDHVVTTQMTPDMFWIDRAPIAVRRRWVSDGFMWKLGCDYFVGQPTDHCYMCFAGPLLTRSATEGFGAYVQSRFGVGPREFFIAQNHGIECSEFELFGTYLQYVDRHGYTLRGQGTVPAPIRQYQSVVAVSEAQKAEIEMLLA